MISGWTESHATETIQAQIPKAICKGSEFKFVGIGCAVQAKRKSGAAYVMHFLLKLTLNSFNCSQLRNPSPDRPRRSGRKPRKGPPGSNAGTPDLSRQQSADVDGDGNANPSPPRQRPSQSSRLRPALKPIVSGVVSSNSKGTEPAVPPDLARMMEQAGAASLDEGSQPQHQVLDDDRWGNLS